MTREEALALAEQHDIDLFRVIRAAGRKDRDKARAASLYLAETIIAEAAAMREALQFYSDRDSYYCGMGDVCISDYPVMDDRGDIARQALAQ